MEFLIRTNGGPFDGETRVVDEGIIRWPPPVNLPGVFHGGVYVLTNHSHLTERQAAHPNVMRGAEYQWQEAS